VAVAHISDMPHNRGLLNNAHGFRKAITSISELISVPAFFMLKPWAVESIINLDNATRQLIPRAEIHSALLGASAPFRAQITVPVLLMQADHDTLFMPQNDAALFSSSPDVSFVLLGKAGKAFLHPTSKTAAVEAIACWIAQRFSH
jgi:pimeloyl-ACP methyl ester carboxylesterase